MQKKIQLKKWAEDLYRHFFPQRSYSDGQQIHEKGDQYH